MTVSLLEILSAARAHAAPLAAESAGYLLLGAADQVAVAPRQIGAEDVELAADGAVRLRASSGATSAESAELGLRTLLGQALQVSSSVGPALRRAAARRETTGLSHLVRELEVALIPVNRAAARRALTRLHRETERALSSGKLVVTALPREDEPSAPPSRVSEPAAQEPSLADSVLTAAEAPATPPPAPALPEVALAPAAPAPLPLVELPELTPEPQIAQADLELTRPEPVVERARRRGSSTPALGTVVTAQTLPDEEAELTERAPAVVVDEEPLDDEPLAIEVDVEMADDVAGADAAAPLWSEPEPSVLPDVLTAMVALHTGVQEDEQPTRLRDVVTASADDDLEDQVTPPLPVALVDSPEAEPLAEAAEPSLEAELPLIAEAEPLLADVQSEEVAAPVYEPAPLFVSELTDPVVHEALTWNPGPVHTRQTPLPPTLLLAEPAPEPSPYAPAVLPARSSDVSELLDSFHVSGAAEEGELRGALKEMAGLEPTPMPHPLVDEA